MVLPEHENLGSLWRGFLSLFQEGLFLISSWALMTQEAFCLACLREQLQVIKLHRTDSSLSGCRAPCVALSFPVWGHPFAEGSWEAATLTDLAFALNVHDKLSESEKVYFGNSLVVQWLGLRASTARGMGSILVQGAEMLQTSHITCQNK